MGTRHNPPAFRATWPASGSVEQRGGDDLLKLTRMSAERGGHIRPGIRGRPYRELGCPTNEPVASTAAEQAQAAGQEIAAAVDVREMLALLARRAFGTLIHGQHRQGRS